jgi:hypothetical protein
VSSDVAKCRRMSSVSGADTGADDASAGALLSALPPSSSARPTVESRRCTIALLAACRPWWRMWKRALSRETVWQGRGTDRKEPSRSTDCPPVDRPRVFGPHPGNPSQRTSTRARHTGNPAVATELLAITA